MRKILLFFCIFISSFGASSQKNDVSNPTSVNSWYSGKMVFDKSEFIPGNTCEVSLLLTNKTDKSIRKSKVIIELQGGVKQVKGKKRNILWAATSKSTSRIDFAIKLPQNCPPVVTFNFKVVHSGRRTASVVATTFGIITVPLLVGIPFLKSNKAVHRTNYDELQFILPVTNPDNVHQDAQYTKNIKKTILKKSDVDMNIPINSGKLDNRFAVIIGNENYSENQEGLSTEANVIFAIHDAKIFKEYCLRTLRIPETNVLYLENASTGKMIQVFDKINKLIKITNGEADVFFYYAGHGLPDEKTKEPYLIPVDVNGSNLSAAIKLDDVLQKLTENPSKRITIFLDACFSGAGREKGLIVARTVRIKPKETPLSGNLVIFSASGPDQMALPFVDKSHGLFTYFLLKKIQETSGNVTYEELASFLEKEVGMKSLLILDKDQIPQVNPSPALGDEWKDWKLNK